MDADVPLLRSFVSTGPAATEALGAALAELATPGWNIYAQRFDPLGDAQGNELILGLGKYPSVMVGANADLIAQTAGPIKKYERVLLVDETGAPITSESLNVGESYIFNYPYATTPCLTSQNVGGS